MYVYYLDKNFCKLNAHRSFKYYFLHIYMKEFNKFDIKNDSIIFIIGNRSSGKTYLANYLLKSNGVLIDSYFPNTIINNENNKQLIITMQYPHLIKNILPDFIFIFRNHNIEYKQLLYDYYVKDIILSFNEFSKLLDEYTMNYQSLVIDVKNKEICCFLA